MDKPTIFKTESRPRETLRDDTTIVGALGALGGELSAQALYQRALREQIFQSVQVADRKQALSFQKALSAQSSIAVLALIWKESTYISERQLVQAGMSRSFTPCTPLNCHSLARSLVPAGADFSRDLKRVEKIVSAGVAYGLFERRAPVSNQSREVCGTASLHQLMLGVGSSFRAVYTDIVAQRSGDQ